MIVLESIYYSIIASFYGILMGMPLSYILYKLMGELRAYEWNIPWSSMVMAFIGSIVIVIIASMISLRKMNKINIMDALEQRNKIIKFLYKQIYMVIIKSDESQHCCDLLLFF